jgi:hypothetical protein
MGQSSMPALIGFSFAHIFTGIAMPTLEALEAVMYF